MKIKDKNEKKEKKKKEKTRKIENYFHFLSISDICLPSLLSNKTPLTINNAIRFEFKEIMEPPTFEES